MTQRETAQGEKLAMLGVIGLGLAMAARRRHWQRYAFGRCTRQGRAGRAASGAMDHGGGNGRKGAPCPR